MDTQLQLTASKNLSAERANPLWAVFRWEMRRRLSKPSFWLIAAFLFLFTLVLMWLGQYKAFLDQKSGVLVAGTTAFGLMQELPGVLLLWFGFVVPFVAVDLASSDVRQRTHELLMSCAIPNKAFLWGRYLVGLCQCLFLAVLLLAGILVMAFALHTFLWLGLDGPGDLIGYPAPNVGVIVFFWALMVLPVVVWFSALSFLFGSLQATSIGMMQVVMACLWLVCSYISLAFSASPISSAFDPTSASISFTFISFYQQRYQLLVQHVANVEQRRAIGNMVQQIIPDTMWLFVLIHSIYAILGLLLVVITIRKFSRFANIM